MPSLSNIDEATIKTTLNMSNLSYVEHITDVNNITITCIFSIVNARQKFTGRTETKVDII